MKHVSLYTKVLTIGVCLILTQLGCSPQKSGDTTSDQDTSKTQQMKKAKTKVTDRVPQGKIKAGDMIRSFVAKSHTGTVVDSDDYKGKIILIDFWATWCRPCHAELPHLGKLVKDFGESTNFAIIGVSLDKNAKPIDAFIEKYGLNYPHVFDGKAWQNDVAKLYGVNSIPFTVIVKEDGQVHRIGMRGKELVEEIRKLVKKD
jgi:peroxiredoxin